MLHKEPFYMEQAFLTLIQMRNFLISEYFLPF